MRTQAVYGLVIGGALALAVALPASAQIPTATPGQAASSQQATASQSGTQNTTAPSGAYQAQAGADTPLTAPVRQGFWGRMNPFARKKYVNGQLAPIRDRVNELDGLTDDNAKAITATDARAKAGIADAQSQAQKASDTANAAQQQAEQDQSQAQQLNQQVGAVGTKLQGVDQFQLAQTAELHFHSGPVKLTADTQQQLDSFLQGLDSQKGYVVEVTAYSSQKGARAETNSQQLADTVVRYLVLQHNVPLYRIYTMGMGNATPADANGQPSSDQMSQATTTPNATAHPTTGGTVEIRILRNSLGTDNQGQGQGGQGQL